MFEFHVDAWLGLSQVCSWTFESSGMSLRFRRIVVPSPSIPGTLDLLTVQVKALWFVEIWGDTSQVIRRQSQRNWVLDFVSLLVSRRVWKRMVMFKFVVSARPSVRRLESKSVTTTGWIFMKFRIFGIFTEICWRILILHKIWQKNDGHFTWRLTHVCVSCLYNVSSLCFLWVTFWGRRTSWFKYTSFYERNIPPFTRQILERVVTYEKYGRAKEVEEITDYLNISDTKITEEISECL